MPSPKVYEPAGILEGFRYETVDDEIVRAWDEDSGFAVQSVGQEAIAEYSWIQTSDVRPSWYPKKSPGLRFESLFVPNGYKANEFTNVSPDDDRMDHGDTGGSGRELFAVHFAMMVRNPANYQYYLKDLLNWNRQQLLRPSGFGTNNEQWGDNFSKKKRGYKSQDPEVELWNHAKVNSIGADHHDYSHLHTPRMHVLAYMRHPLGVLNCLNLVQSLARSTHGTSNWMTQVRGNLVLLEAIPWFYLKIDDEGFIEDRLDGLTVQTWLDAKLRQLVDPVEYGQRQTWERQTSKNLGGGLADLGDGRIPYLLSFHHCIALSVCAKLHYWLKIERGIAEEDQRREWLEMLEGHADWLKGTLESRKAIRKNGKLARAVGEETYDDEQEAGRALDEAMAWQQKQKNPKTLQVFNSQAGFRLREGPRFNDTELGIHGMLYFDPENDFCKSWLDEAKRDPSRWNDRWTLWARTFVERED